MIDTGIYFPLFDSPECNRSSHHALVLFTWVNQSGSPANAEGQERVWSCVSVYSASDGRIQLKVLPDYYSHSTVENRTC
jgi:hypothetical protein